MTPEELRKRTRAFALRVMRVVEALPRGRSPDVIARQLTKAGTSVGANYRAACRARSNADFIAKMSIVEEEVDETIYWMELLAEAGLLKKAAIDPLLQEARELLAITVASINTARGKIRARRQSPSGDIGR
ncbi:MAG: four helix bundle protein [Planctomycetota bacterium]|nr:four helix bundle protein [Planctomycetota bacterium]